MISCNASDVDSSTLKDVLPYCLKSFFRDFSVDDVMIRYIFNEEEMRNILAQSTEEKKILQLFWILQDKAHLIQPFLNQIREWYPWLSQQVYEEVITGRDKNQYLCAVKRLRRNFQKHLDFNVHRMEFYWPVRLALLKLKPYNFLVLSGDLGIGKKWILLDVCSEYEVMKEMGFNIFWLDVHNCNRREDDFMALQQLQLHIEDTESTWRRSSEFDGIENKILHLQQRIRERLQQDKFKDCLLVLSGVQNSKTWKNLHLGSKIVIITRNQNIFEKLSETTAKHISIDSGFNLTECYQYFEKVLKRNRSTFPECTSDIFSLSKGQPLLLSIIANNLKVNQVWSKWKNNLENLEIPDKLNMVVEISLKVLKPELMVLYRTFSIFPHSVEIPLKLLASLWKKTERESEKILETFYKYSIINRNIMPDKNVAYILPYIYSMYLKNFDQNSDRSMLHNHIVNYYRIREIPLNRRDGELYSFCNDYYFYHCIGYHLKESNNLDIFPKLFLDLTFLGKKLRYDGFSNTIVHLKHFEKEITGNDIGRQQLLSEILAFLPHAETVLLLSADTNLLQYALMADGLIKEEAIRQASLYKYRIWFEDKGHFHQRRQVVRLPEKIHMIKSITADICVIALHTNDILLVDFSLDANNDHVYLTGNQYQIREIKFFLDDYIITLDVKGNLKVWSIIDDRRRNACFERNVNPLNLVRSPQMQKRRCKQLIEKNIRGPIKAFHTELLLNNEVELHLAFGNGDICIYSWDSNCEEFRIKSLPILPTKVQNICYLSKILNKYYLVLNTAGDIYFFNLYDSSQTARSFEWPKLLKLIYVGECKREEIKIIIFVYSEKVLYLSIAPQKFELLKGDLKLVYNIIEHDFENSINCACISHDGRYLVLGTKYGLVVFNIATQTEVLRGNISESIECVDVYPLDDNLYKYLILCASEQSHVLSLFALKELDNNTLAWSYHLSNLTGSSADANAPMLEPNVWLQGKKLFDLNQENQSVLIAVDSKNRIREVTTTNEHKWSILPTQKMRNITAITMCGRNMLCSYDDGNVYNITDGVFLQSLTHSNISYLQMINAEIFIASSEIDQKSVIQHLEKKAPFKMFEIYFYKTFTYLEKYSVLISPIGRFVVVDLSDNFKLLYDTKDTRGAIIGGCDFKNDDLVLVTTDFTVLIYKFKEHHGNLNIRCVQHTKAKQLSKCNEVTTTANSHDGSLLAVGMKSGIIEVYQMQPSGITLIFCLTSHKSQIYDLKFSPNSEVLVSCSEQLCFWHVPFILNNPIEKESKQNRRSSRFRSSNSQEDDHASSSADHQNTEAGTADTLWSNKSGTMEKPELLSCIKFVGTKAEIFFANYDFTQFYTIDNEGVYYHLCLYDFSQKIEKGGAHTNRNVLMKKNRRGNEYIT